MNGKRGFGLIGLLVAIAVIAVAIALVYGGRSHEDSTPTRPGGPTTRVGKDLDRGRAVDCQNNLRQIRTAIDMELTASTETNAPPPNLESLSKDGIVPQMLKCPVSQLPYQYDAQSGRVWCPTQGHEKF